jgi:uncharacterized tellurite resistance protein B-like protein
MGFSRTRKAMEDLFKGLQGKGLSDKLDVPSAVMLPMVAMMWADDEKHQAESRLIHVICDLSPIFANYTRPQIDDLVDRSEAIFHDKKAEAACRLAAGALSYPLRQTAYAFAVQVLFADEKVVGAEQERASKLAEWLELEPQLARDIVKVISILRHDRDAR